MSEELNEEAENDTEETEVIEEAENDNEEELNEDEEQEDGPLVVSFGDEEPDEEDQEEAPPWVKEVRASNRELKKKNKELESKIAEKEEAKQQNTLGDKPKLEDFDYDAEQYAPALETWLEKKRSIDKRQATAKEQDVKREEEFNAKKVKYRASVSELNVDDFDEAEDVVADKISELHQNIIIMASDNPTTFVYGLKQNKAALDKLSAITDPIKFAVEIGRMEAQMKTRTGKRAPKPEKRLSGNGSGGGSDKKMERLEKEAAKSGDRTQIMAYKRELKRAS